MSGKIKTYLPMILIGALAFIVYANTLGNGFVYDDYQVIADNVWLRRLDGLAALFTPRYFDVFREASYRPVVTLTYFLDYRLWGLKAGGYHLTNVLLHALNAVLVYLFLRDRLKKPGVALAASLLFALHPVASEAVNGISFREDLLALFFGLLALLAYERAPADSRGRGRYLGGFLAAFFLALFAKEEALILPGLMILLEICFGKDIFRAIRKKAPYYAGLLLILGFYLLVRFALLRSPQEEGFTPVPLPARLLTESKVIFFYLGLLLFPLRLSVEYVYPLSVFLREPGVLFSILGLLVILLAMIRYHRRYPGPVFGAGWFFLALLPAADIFPLFNQVAERYLYFPLAGFCLLAALAGEAVSARPRAGGRHLLTGLLAVVLAFFFLRTFMRNRDWKDCLTLYEKTVQTCPNSPRFFNNLGLSYKAAGRPEDAIKAYRKSIALNPEYSRPYYNLGSLYREQGKREEALALLQKAVELRPDFADAYVALGLLYHQPGVQRETEIEYYHQAINRDPGNARAYYNLGIALWDSGRTEEAIASYRKAIEVDPFMDVAYNNLGNVYFSLGRNDEAVSCFRKAIALKPNSAGTYNNLGIIYGSRGKLEEALSYYRKSLELKPDYAETYYNIGMSYSLAGKSGEAIAALRKAVELDPGYARAHSSLAIEYFSAGRYDLAVKHCDCALELGYRMHPEFLEKLKAYR